MKKWILSAIGYLLVVIVGYFIYASVNSQGDGAVAGSKHEIAGEAEGHGGHGATEHSGDSEVKIDLTAQDSEIVIALADAEGNPVELQMNHEKLLHLIVVDEHLEQYYHLHPEEVESGKFAAFNQLKEGTYKAFVDIKPSDLAYHVEPQVFTIGEKEGEQGHTSLEPDTTFTKFVNGVEARFKPSSLKVNEKITLSFEFPNGEKLEPYLGALGHVVILDEAGEKFIHVHPANEFVTKFITEFKEPGIYKLWAEFQISGEVHTYPFTIEIE